MQAVPGGDAINAFPDPVEPPSHVRSSRDQRVRRLRGLVLVGLIVRGSIVAAELAAWRVLDSATLLVDAVASAMDIVASLALLTAVLLATRPPDDDHPFGHGRYEPLAGLQLGILMAAAGVWLLLRPWSAGVTLLAAWWAYLIPLAAAVLLAAVGLRMRHAARETGSPALAAEAAHYFIDAVTSLLAAAGLATGSLLPEWSAMMDGATGMVLSLLMIGLGLLSAWENVHQVVDRSPDESYFDRVRQAAVDVSGVLDVEKVRIQIAGPDAHVDIDIEVDPEMTVADSHVIAQHVRAAIQSDWPHVREVVVHVEPWFDGDH